MDGVVCVFPPAGSPAVDIGPGVVCTADVAITSWGLGACALTTLGGDGGGRWSDGGVAWGATGGGRFPDRGGPGNTE